MGNSAKIRHRRRRRQLRYQRTAQTARALKETLDYILGEMPDYSLDYSKWFVVKTLEPREVGL